MIYVTHDQVEAMTLADKIVVLQGGIVEQVGTPLELYHHPAQPVRRRLHRLAQDELPAEPRSVGGRRRAASRSSCRAATGSRCRCSPARSQSRRRRDARRPARASAPADDGEIDGEVLVAERLGGETFLYTQIADEHDPGRPGRRREPDPRARPVAVEHQRRAPAICSSRTALRSSARSAIRWPTSKRSDRARGEPERGEARMYLEKYDLKGRVARGHRRRPGHRLRLRPGAGRGRRQGDRGGDAARPRRGRGPAELGGLGIEAAARAARRHQVGAGRRGRGPGRARASGRRRHPGQQCRRRQERRPRRGHQRRALALPHGRQPQRPVLVLPRLRPADAGSAARARSSMSARCRASSSTSRSRRRSTTPPRRPCIT